MDRPDLAWTLLLQRRLPAVLARLFPEVHALIDWEQEYYLPDKSLPPRSPTSRTGAREPDFIALVALLDGSRACVHIEVQCTRQAHFAERMALYHARLRDHYSAPPSCSTSVPKSRHPAKRGIRSPWPSPPTCWPSRRATAQLCACAKSGACLPNSRTAEN
jgi:hypothetical protein